MSKSNDFIQVSLDWLAEGFPDDGNPFLCLDAATGAGNTTLKLAQLFNLVDQLNQSYAGFLHAALSAIRHQDSGGQRFFNITGILS